MTVLLGQLEVGDLLDVMWESVIACFRKEALFQEA